MNSLLEIYSVLIPFVVAYMTAWFGAAVLLRRRDIIDSAWGLGFIGVALVSYLLSNSSHIFTFLAVCFVAVWGMRLFLHIAARNKGKKEDYRYTQLGELGTLRVWARTYVSVFLLQGVLMLVISLPVVGIMQANTEPMVWLASIGFTAWLFGIVFEAIADYQLKTFIDAKRKGIMQSGLWRYSRHPNYFGEVTAWWGAAIVAAAFGQWWGILGAWTITILILKISGVPLLEKRYKDNAAYQSYAQRTSIFIPLPPKGSR